MNRSRPRNGGFHGVLTRGLAPDGSFATALALAERAHAGQVDKNDEPYIGHIYRVIARLEGTGDAQIVGALHDTVEDTEVTLDTLRSLGFSDDVVEAVGAMTHHKGEPRVGYLSALAANPLARVAKWADNSDNSDPGRLARVAERDPAEAERLATKYERDRSILDAAGPRPPFARPSSSR